MVKIFRVLSNLFYYSLLLCAILLFLWRGTSTSPLISTVTSSQVESEKERVHNLYEGYSSEKYSNEFNSYLRQINEGDRDLSNRMLEVYNSYIRSNNANSSKLISEFNGALRHSSSNSKLEDRVDTLILEWKERDKRNWEDMDSELRELILEDGK